VPALDKRGQLIEQARLTGAARVLERCRAELSIAK
jgi:hypothetical protein